MKKYGRELGVCLAAWVLGSAATASVGSGGRIWAQSSAGEGWTGRTVAVANLGTEVVSQFGPYFDHTRIYSAYDQDPPVPVVDSTSSVATFHHQVDAADTRDLCVSIHDVYADSSMQARRVVLKRFSATSPGSNWTYQHPTLTNGHDLLRVRVSRDGSRIVAVIYNHLTNKADVVVFGPDSPTPVSSFSVDTMVAFKALDLSADGTRLLLSSQLQLKVLSLPSGGVLHSEMIFDTNFGAFGISGDGSYFAYGTTGKAKVYKRQSSGAYSLYCQPAVGLSGNWVCDRLDLSDDNSTLVLAYNLTDTFRTVHVQAVDLPSQAIVMGHTSTGQGSLQNCVADVSVNSDGSRFAVATWGDEQGLAPEVLIYSRSSSTPLRTIDLPGSALALDISGNGQRVAVAAKAMHANQAGGGGSIELFQVEAPDLALSGTPRVATQITAHVAGTPGRPAMLLVASTLRSVPQVFPGIGTLYLGTQGFVRRPLGTCDANGVASGPWLVPGSVGTTCYVQGFATQPRRLTATWLGVTVMP